MRILPDANTRAPIQLLWFLLIVFVSGLFIYLLGLLLAVPIFGLTINELQVAMGQEASPANMEIFLYFQFISQAGIFIVPPLLFGWLVKKNNLYFFHLDRRPAVRSLFYVFLIAFTILPIINVFAEWNQQFHFPDSFSALQEWMESREAAAQEITQLFLGRTSVLALASNLLLIAVVPAIGEELFFRGVLQKTFTGWFNNVHLSVLLTSVIFSALHMQFFGFLPRLTLGLLFGYYFYWSRSLWLPIFAHFVNNSAAVIVAFLAARNTVETNYEEFGNYNQQLPIIVINTVISVALLFFIYREEAKRKA